LRCVQPLAYSPVFLGDVSRRSLARAFAVSLAAWSMASLTSSVYARMASTISPASSSTLMTAISAHLPSRPLQALQPDPGPAVFKSVNVLNLVLNTLVDNLKLVNRVNQLFVCWSVAHLKDDFVFFFMRLGRIVCLPPTVTSCCP